MTFLGEVSAALIKFHPVSLVLVVGLAQHPPWNATGAVLVERMMLEALDQGSIELRRHRCLASTPEAGVRPPVRKNWRARSRPILALKSVS